MAEELQSSFPTQFLQQLLGPDSPFLYLRTNNSAKVGIHWYCTLGYCIDTVHVHVY